MLTATNSKVNNQGVNTPTNADVAVKSAYRSKINWLQVVSALVTCTTGVVGAFNLDAAQAATLTAAVAAVGQLVTIVLRTFYTTTVVQNSIPK